MPNSASAGEARARRKSAEAEDALSGLGDWLKVKHHRDPNPWRTHF